MRHSAANGLVRLFYEVLTEQDVTALLLALPQHPDTDLFFHDEGRLLTYRQIQYMYDKAFKIAGLNFSGTHVLRHSGSTSFYNATGDLLALQHMGTWSNSRMPQHYAKVTGSTVKDAIARIQDRPNSRLLKADV